MVLEVGFRTRVMLDLNLKGMNSRCQRPCKQQDREHEESGPVDPLFMIMRSHLTLYYGQNP